MKAKMWTIVALVSTLLIWGCGQQQQDASPDGSAVADTEQLTPYSLEIYLDGLIAFVKDPVDVDGEQQERAWAILAKANYDPSSATKVDLPPCVLDEADSSSVGREAFLQYNYPPHLPYIRFQNATAMVDGVAVPKEGLSLADRDVRVSTGTTQLTYVDWDKLGSHEEVEAVFGAQTTNFDVLDSGYVGPWGSVPQYAVSRVLIEDGEMSAQETVCDVKYKFKKTDMSLCPSALGTASPIAEEVLVKRSGLLSDVTLSLTNRNGAVQEVAVQPVDRNKPVVIEILNVLEKHINTIDDINVEGDKNQVCAGVAHLDTYRWFYRLSQEKGADQCIDHYAPCQHTGSMGGRKCPQKAFELP